jgi:hypothetical protein
VKVEASPSVAARLRTGVERYGSRVIRWTLGAIVAVSAIVGLLFITRGTAVKQIRAVGVDGTPVAPAESSFALIVALLTGTPLLAGNRVELALNGDGTFPHLWADLRSAQRSITVQMYYAAPGRVADTLATILAERARAGTEKESTSSTLRITFCLVMSLPPLGLLLAQP